MRASSKTPKPPNLCKSVKVALKLSGFLFFLYILPNLFILKSGGKEKDGFFYPEDKRSGKRKLKIR